MDTTTLAQMQIRVVVTVFRSELAKLPDTETAEARAAVERLRQRSLELLEQTTERLAADGEMDPETETAIRAARRELDEFGAVALSPGSRGDRRE